MATNWTSSGNDAQTWTTQVGVGSVLGGIDSVSTVTQDTFLSDNHKSGAWRNPKIDSKIINTALGETLKLSQKSHTELLLHIGGIFLKEFNVSINKMTKFFFKTIFKIIIHFIDLL